MLNIEDIKVGFQSIDSRPVVVWEGNVGSAKNHRIVFTKKNTLVIEVLSTHDAMGNKVWVKNADAFIEGEILASALLESFRKIAGI